MTSDDCKFFIPGPTWVRPALLQEMTRPMIGHRSAEFKELFRGIVADLKPLFGTAQDTLVATCSGTGLMQAALGNAVARRVLVTSCGAFSERWAAIAESLGLEVDRLDAGWGNAVERDQLADHLASRRAHYDAVTLTHNETSTGVTNDVQALAAVVREASPGTLVLVDAVSSLGGIPVRFDDWGFDICFASVQKGIALPPGITVFALSQQALARSAKMPYRGTYFDFMQY
jgi:aspartate aminotransferase-like enzyme